MKDANLHIICLMKIVDDIDDISPKEYKLAGEECLDMTYVRKMINCFDEAALENALLIKDKRCEAGLDTRISVISLDPGYASHFLNPFFAMKVDDVINIETDGNTWYDPMQTASVLWGEINKIKNEEGDVVIFAGKQAPPLNSGMVPAVVAEYMGYPLINEVTDLYYREDDFVVERVAKSQKEYYRINKDAVLVFGNTVHSYLRVPTLREKMKFKKCKPEVVNISLEKPGEEPKLSCQIQEIECDMVAFADEREAADKILELVLGKNE